MQVSKNTNLFMASCEIKYATYIVGWSLEVIKACGKGAFSLRWRHFIAETTPPVRSEKKNREKKPTTPAHSEQ